MNTYINNRLNNFLLTVLYINISLKRLPMCTKNQLNAPTELWLQWKSYLLPYFDVNLYFTYFDPSFISCLINIHSWNNNLLFTSIKLKSVQISIRYHNVKLMFKRFRHTCTYHCCIYFVITVVLPTKYHSKRGYNVS